MSAELEIRIRLTPHPDKVPPETFDAAMNGEITNFEKWFLNQQVTAGRQNPEGLLGVERGVLKRYIFWLATKEPV